MHCRKIIPILDSVIDANNSSISDNNNKKCLLRLYMFPWGQGNPFTLITSALN